MIFTFKCLKRSVILLELLLCSFSFSMHRPSPAEINFASRVHACLMSVDNTKVGETLISIIDGSYSGFVGNKRGAMLNDQKKEISTHLRLHRHFGNDPKLLRAGEHFTLNPQYPSFFRITGVNTADEADRIAEDLIDYILSSKVHMEVGKLQTGNRANRFLLTANICGHGISKLKFIPCYYNANPTISSYRLSSRVQMVVSAQTQYAGHSYAPDEQTVMITLFPDKRESLCTCRTTSITLVAMFVLLFVYNIGSVWLL